ncbi:MAG: Asp-tRNA(Asn)/Glu-tRNA(Gln) amidotransferase subunit GatC [Candidatus Abawacabacteria bacterium]|nr:Asp-tRNA(Asn)/Glu-tRNA(Gln) amidotransferase subunit GatC [Candidatus Abawacabacteria bacterium]
MSTISDRVEIVARLSKLTLTAEEKAKFSPQLDNIVDYLENLQEVNTSDIQPTRQVTGLTNVMRPDIVSGSTIQKKLLNCTPLSVDNDHVVVPSVFA